MNPYISSLTKVLYQLTKEDYLTLQVVTVRVSISGRFLSTSTGNLQKFNNDIIGKLNIIKMKSHYAISFFCI